MKWQFMNYEMIFQKCFKSHLFGICLEPSQRHYTCEQANQVLSRQRGSLLKPAVGLIHVWRGLVVSILPRPLSFMNEAADIVAKHKYQYESPYCKFLIVSVTIQRNASACGNLFYSCYLLFCDSPY